MKRALSLILGLLVLLTAFSSGVSAETVRFDSQNAIDNNINVIASSGTYNYGYDATMNALEIQVASGKFSFLLSKNYTYYSGMKIAFNMTIKGSTVADSNDGVAWGFLVTLADNTQKILYHRSGGNTPSLGGYSGQEVAYHGGSYTSDYEEIDVDTDLSAAGIDTAMVVSITPFVGVWEDGSTNTWHVYAISVTMPSYNVTFSLKDALTGQSLTGVTIKENGIVLGTIDDGQSLQLEISNHTLTFEKSGYWSVTKTIDVQNDMSVSVEMYPSSTAFQFLNFPSDIEVYENTIYELTFTISPIDTSATYNTYLSISGLNNVLEVKKAGQVITPENGKYYLGDISGDTQISIKFKAGSIGAHSFTITLTSNDAVMSSTYTTSKQVAYNVIPLPFSVQMPSEWQVGTNELRISESSGQTLLITAILKDSQGNEVWSDSSSLGPYEAYTFQVNVPSEGTYTLELQFNGQTASWDISVNPAISLLTKTITASEGDIATVQVKLKNPSSNTKYYTIVLEGPIIEGNVSKSVSVAPLSEKIVDVSFQVPKDLTYDAYDLNVKVYEGDALQFTDIVHLVIENSGFSLLFFGGGSSAIDSTWLWLGAGVLALFVFIMALRRR